MYGCMDVWMYGWMYGWMDGWMDVCPWMYGWMDGWMDVCPCLHSSALTECRISQFENFLSVTD
jgi:hypothetical protein